MFYAIKSALPYTLFPTELASPSRDSVLYMTLGGPLSEPPEANGTYDLYEAVRSTAGWSTDRRLSPSGSQAVFPNAGGVSSDHLYAFTEVGPVEGTREGGAMAADGNAEYLSDPDGSFELVGMGSLGTERLAEGRFISPGGEHIIFTTGGAWCSLEGAKCEVRRLEMKAPETGTPTIYDRPADGLTKVVSLLPGNVTPSAGEGAEYQGSSADGSVVVFKIGDKLYARLNDELTEEVASGSTVFAGVAADGSRIFYLHNGDIYAFDTSTGTTRRGTSSEDIEVVNVSSDGSHVYFVSSAQLDYPEGTAGSPNLYVWSIVDDQVNFIATVSAADLEGASALTNWTDSAVLPNKIDDGQGPGADTSRSTPDGNILVFESRAKLTSYETAGRVQIYRYDAEAKTIQCVSCNPLRAESEGNARLEDVGQLGASAVIHNLSTDGSSVYFETSEALVARDTDGLNDIYEWNASPPMGMAPLSLISSGSSPRFSTFEGTSLATNILFGITPSGSDVVFLAYEQLVASAPQGGFPALYDARVDGGFPEPLQGSRCSGEECRGPAGAAPVIAGPSSSPVATAGNVRSKNRQHHHCQQTQATSRRKAHRRCHEHNGRHHPSGAARRDGVAEGSR